MCRQLGATYLGHESDSETEFGDGDVEHGEWEGEEEELPEYSRYRDGAGRLKMDFVVMVLLVGLFGGLMFWVGLGKW